VVRNIFHHDTRLASAAAALCLCSLACGGGGGSDSMMGPSGTVTLADVQAQIFSPKCALSGCHIGTNPPRGLDLSSGNAGANTVGVASDEQPALLRIEPYDVANSYLYMKVTADPGISGDPMPLNRPPLNDSDLALLAAWIDQGAL